MMRKGFLSVLMVSFLLLGPALPLGGTDGGGDLDGGTGSRGGEVTPWTDSLDDMSHVYESGAGLVGVEVSGGEAHLLPGEDEGWIASSIITCPEGVHYDLVLLEAVVPGNSKVSISVLDPTEESSVVGYANETVPGYVHVEKTSLSLYFVDHTEYPQIRIQVDLKADGTDRPRLLAWSLPFTGFDEWSDDLLGTGKMSSSDGIVVTEGTVKVDRSEWRSPIPSDYEAYPPLVFTRYQSSGSTTMDVFFPNSDRTGYEDYTRVSCDATQGVSVADLNGDGYLDLVCANQLLNNERVDSQILWGDSSGEWSQSDATDLKTEQSRHAAIGDFNGDGELDIFVGTRIGNWGGQVFFNQGEGVFNYEPDYLSSNGQHYETDVADWNGDGFDDVAYGDRGGVDRVAISLGGPAGLGPTISYIAGATVNTPVIEDIDLDGHLDVVMGGNAEGGDYDKMIPVYLGGQDERRDWNLDHADYLLPMTDDTCTRAAVGDLNGDGFIELLYSTETSSTGNLIYFEGTSEGWGEENRHIIELPAVCHALKAFDVNKDGYDDILLGHDGDEFELYYGGDYWPTTPNVTKSCTADPVGLTVVVPRELTTEGYHGYFVTEPITLPSGMKWDMALLDAEIPEGTWAYISIYDEDMKLLADVSASSSAVDLSALTDTRTIRVKATLWSRTDTNTPVMDRVAVTWMDEMTWRDGFHGDSRVDHLRNLAVADGSLQMDQGLADFPQILITQAKGYFPFAFFDSGGLEYIRDRDFGNLFGASTSAVSVVDVNGDDLLDLAFANLGSEGQDYVWVSTIYLNSAIGFQSDPSYRFPTVGAKDLVVEDLNGDGYLDVVFAQEMNATTHDIDSTLFWGSASGWNETPDVNFSTTGADDVEAADLDGDGLLDLVFACYMNTTTSTDSMVFMQDEAGFCGTSPLYRLPTKGARGVGVADLNDDGNLDLVFANKLSGGLAEIDSYIYWGRGGGRFFPSPDTLPTSGAEDVLVEDLDGDGDLDIVFANNMDDTGSNDVDSFVYLNDGSGGFGSAPYSMLRTPGATAVTAADLDHIGWKDLAFACYENDTAPTPSLVFLGGLGGWSNPPDIELADNRGTDIVVADLFEPGTGSYSSDSITVEDTDTFDRFHTLGYTASLGPAQSGTIYLRGSKTEEVLLEKDLEARTVEIPLGDLAMIKDHTQVQVMLYVEGLDQAGTFSLDDLWINWTKRVLLPPRVGGLEVSPSSVYRTQAAAITIDVSDDYDLSEDLEVSVVHRLNGTQDPWINQCLRDMEVSNGTFHVVFETGLFSELGMYDLRVRVMDSDALTSGWMVFPCALEVLNNLPTPPVVRITPPVATSTTSLAVEIVEQAWDLESLVDECNYTWYRDGELYPEVDGTSLDAIHTHKGENWSVVVTAFDDDGASASATAWIVIENGPPVLKNQLPDPEFEEDTTDSNWLDLSCAFEDPDGDPLTWTLASTQEHLTVTIDQDTGRVTLVPGPDWYGVEEITFLASDGEEQASCTVAVTVLSVNDIPWIAAVDGAPPGNEPLTYQVSHGQTLTIDYTVADIEDDEIAASLNITTVDLDESAGTMAFVPNVNEAGLLRFTLSVWDVVSPDARVTLDFVIEVLNVNDPMDQPWITSLFDGSKFDINTSVDLVASCEDPDLMFGQVLNYTWESNISGLLGYGQTLFFVFRDPGTHLITLTVRDPDYEKSTVMRIIIEPEEVIEPAPVDGDPDPESEESMLGLMFGALAALVVIGVVVFIVTTRRRTETQEAADEADYKREHMERAYEAVKAAADKMEAELVNGAEEASDEENGGTKTEVLPDVVLSMEAKETEAASAQTMALFGEARAAEPLMSEEEAEQLRLDNLKRKYQNAIGRLPYGIPSKELQDWEWVDLAAALATGEKKETPQGQEITQIDGRWYFSDVKDTGTFLKEHGAKKERKEEQRKATPSVDKAALLAKLEERFILGEISEEAYDQLKDRYSREE